MPKDRVIDTDITVEEAARTLITSGVAAGDVEKAQGPSLEQFRRLKSVEYIEDIVQHAREPEEDADDDHCERSSPARGRRRLGDE